MARYFEWVRNGSAPMIRHHGPGIDPERQVVMGEGGERRKIRAADIIRHRQQASVRPTPLHPFPSGHDAVRRKDSPCWQKGDHGRKWKCRHREHELLGYLLLPRTIHTRRRNIVPGDVNPSKPILKSLFDPHPPAPSFRTEQHKPIWNRSSSFPDHRTAAILG